jgi:CO/xanthine dehydrogenase FAD-binding subunit
MTLADFEHILPDTVETALAAYRRSPKPVYIAGGTDLLPNLKNDLFPVSTVVDLTGISDLARIEVFENEIFIGAMASLSDIAGHPAIRRTLPLISTAARRVASWQIRNLATIGGNILQKRRCLYYNQSRFWRSSIDRCFQTGGTVCHQVPKAKECRALYYSDIAPALLAYDARAMVRAETGETARSLMSLLERQIQGESSGEIVTGFSVPKPTLDEKCVFRKTALRGAVDFAAANVAVRFIPEAPPVVRIFVGAAARLPLRLDETEAEIVNQHRRLSAAGPELMTRAVAEAEAKSELIRETGISITAKRNSLAVAAGALRTLFTGLSG